MNDEKIYYSLEKLNEEKKKILNSKEYKLGNFLIKNVRLIKRLKFAKFFSNIKAHINKKIISKKYTIKVDSKTIINHLNYKNKRIAIYTCIIGDYDNIQLPLVDFPNVEYYLLTDDEKKYQKYSNLYKIILLNNDILRNGNIIANRYAKFHPREFFKDYDYSIYIDGNVRIVSDIRKYISYINEKTGIAMYNHRERDDIYQEAKVCKLLGRGNSKYIDYQMDGYKREKFPKKYGMNEATIIVSDINNRESQRLLDEWFKEFKRSKSLRDQLAWPYILWKNKYIIDDVGSLGNNIFQDNKIELVKHID